MKDYERFVELKLELGKIVRGPLQELLDFCIKHPNICNPLYEREPFRKPEPDPLVALGDVIFRFVQGIGNLESTEVFGPNYVDPAGKVYGRTGTWNIKAKYARQAIQAVLSEEENAQIAVQQLEQTIKVNEQTIALQRMMLDMAKKQL
jgi:hypothetical protein